MQGLLEISVSTSGVEVTTSWDAAGADGWNQDASVELTIPFDSKGSVFYSCTVPSTVILRRSSSRLRPSFINSVELREVQRFCRSTDTQTQYAVHGRLLLMLLQ